MYPNFDEKPFYLLLKEFFFNPFYFLLDGLIYLNGGLTNLKRNTIFIKKFNTKTILCLQLEEFYIIGTLNGKICNLLPPSKAQNGIWYFDQYVIDLNNGYEEFEFHDFSEEDLFINREIKEGNEGFKWDNSLVKGRFFILMKEFYDLQRKHKKLCPLISSEGKVFSEVEIPRILTKIYNELDCCCNKNVKLKLKLRFPNYY